MLYHGLFFLTDTRREQFNLALYLLTTGVKKYNDIPSIIPISPLMSALPTSALNYTLLPFFANWVVGFTIAEGSFLVKANLDAQ